MKDNRVISRKRIPHNLPTTTTLTVILALDHWKAPEWLWAVVITFLAFIWIAFIVSIWNHDYVDILEEKETTKKLEKSKFQQRLEEVAEIQRTK